MWTASLTINGLLSSGKETEWSVHAMEHELSAFYDITHGTGLAILTPYWMEYALAENTLDKFVEYGINVWGIDSEQDKYKIAQAALRAKKAGFDGVQFHSAHGYLYSQFLSPHYNKRTDEYGGSIENRGRIIFETLAAVRDKVGKDFPVMIKLNSSDFKDDGFTFKDCKYICQRLDELGIDAIEISG